MKVGQGPTISEGCYGDQRDALGGAAYRATRKRAAYHRREDENSDASRDRGCRAQAKDAAEHDASSQIAGACCEKRHPRRLSNLSQRKAMDNLEILRKPKSVKVPDRIAEDFGQGELPKKPGPQQKLERNARCLVVWCRCIPLPIEGQPRRDRKSTR